MRKQPGKSHRDTEINPVKQHMCRTGVAKNDIPPVVANNRGSFRPNLPTSSWRQTEAARAMMPTLLAGVRGHLNEHATDEQAAKFVQNAMNRSGFTDSAPALRPGDQMMIDTAKDATNGGEALSARSTLVHNFTRDELRGHGLGMSSSVYKNARYRWGGGGLIASLVSIESEMPLPRMPKQKFMLMLMALCTSGVEHRTRCSS
jgi:hypothetical protein